MVLLLLLAALGTSFLSGFLGMAGGMLLMGAYAWLLPVSAAMVLHGVTQLSSNGARTFLLWGFIRWEVLRPYLWGCVSVGGLLALGRVSLPRPWIFLVLGALPFVASAGRGVLRLEILRPWVAFWCGVIVTTFQLIAGVSGPALDVFFQQSTLSPEEIVATKAMTQTLGHGLKLLYYGVIFSAFSRSEALTLERYALVIIASYVGARLGKVVLMRIEARHFRALTQWLLWVIGAVYLYQGVTLLWR